VLLSVILCNRISRRRTFDFESSFLLFEELWLDDESFFFSDFSWASSSRSKLSEQMCNICWTLSTLPVPVWCTRVNRSDVTQVRQGSCNENAIEQILQGKTLTSYPSWEKSIHSLPVWATVSIKLRQLQPILILGTDVAQSIEKWTVKIQAYSLELLFLVLTDCDYLTSKSRQYNRCSHYSMALGLYRKVEPLYAFLKNLFLKEVWNSCFMVFDALCFKPRGP